MSIINEARIFEELATKVDVSDSAINDILNRSLQLKGLSYHDVLTLLHVEDKSVMKRIFAAAREVKEEIYGKRLVLFAPLYISNLCKNECTYCAFHCTNTELHRKRLVRNEVIEETKQLIEQGHKRVLMVAGEADTLDYITDSIDAIYSVKTAKGNIRRINANVAPMSVDDFKKLKAHNLGTYQCFQETYHRESYSKYHLRGPKADYDYRIEAMDRAMSAGIDDVGIGALFGLYDWKFEVLAMLSHITHLEKEFGVGPHTISVPRIEPAVGSAVSFAPPFKVSDDDFKKIIAVLRLAVPYTGIILSTRENAATRHEALDYGVSQISAASKTNPGGYGESSKEGGKEEQFSLGDTRSLLEVVKDVVGSGYIPSFCTGCYRMGRVGHDFMDLAKPGLIKCHCLPNAFFTFAEYIYDFGDEEIKKSGMALIDTMIKRDLPDSETLRATVNKNLADIAQGKRDIYL